MSLIHTSTRLGPIDPANLAGFKELAADLMASTQGEDGTLRYDWFFTDDETWCEVREIFADSDAVLVHAGNAGERLGRLVALGGGLKLELFGDPSPELCEMLASFGETPILRTFQSK